MLGLPDGITVCLFDLDGVLTDTASVHDKAWTQTFDAVLQEQGKSDGKHYDPFDPEADYATYVDGKPRADGVRDFLAARDITLPEGKDDDPPDAMTVNGVGNRKNELLLKMIHDDGVTVFDGSRRYLQACRDNGMRAFVVSSSANTEDVLIVTGLDEFIEGRIDGVIAKKKHLAGKPSPEPYLAGAQLAHVPPAEAAVFEDATAGVQSGHAGRFGAVVGVNRTGHGEHADELRANGATIVVSDLAELLPAAASETPGAGR